MSEERQIKGLEGLARMLGAEKDGKELLSALRRLEESMHRYAEMACNGDIPSSLWTTKMHYAEKRVKSLFGTSVPGFFVNGDPRGYALKIEDNIERNVLYPKGIYLHRDFGGYAILAPEKGE